MQQNAILQYNCKRTKCSTMSTKTGRNSTINSFLNNSYPLILQKLIAAKITLFTV